MFRGNRTVYIYQESKLLPPVACFAKLVKTGLWDIWAEKHEQYTWFLPRPARKELNVLKSNCSNVSATPIGQTGLEMEWFPLGNGVCLFMKKAPSDSPIWQLEKRELLLPLSFLITKPLKLDWSNLHYGPHYKPHNRTQGCVINPIKDPVKES